MEQVARCLGVRGASQWERAAWLDDSSWAKRKPFTLVALSSVALPDTALSVATFGGTIIGPLEDGCGPRGAGRANREKPPSRCAGAGEEPLKRLSACAVERKAAARRLALHQSHEPGLRTTIVLPLKRPSRL